MAIGKNQCQHGSLARVCEVCELRAERDTLAEEVAGLRERFDKQVDYSIAMQKLISGIARGDPASAIDAGDAPYHYEIAVRTVNEWREKLAAVAAERDALRVALDRASGALVDAGTVPTDDIEAGVRALTAERDGLKKVVDGAAKL